MSLLARLSLKNKSIVALIAIAIIVAGIIVIPALKQELYPSLEFPAITVVSTYAGASPSIVETDVTNPIEQSLQGLSGVQTTTSFSNQGSSVIEIQFDYSTDLSKAQQSITTRVSQIQATLPAGVTPQVQSFNLSDLPIIRLAVTSSENQQDLAADVKKTVVPALQGISGVANVTITGERTRVVTIALDPDKLKSEGLSATAVSGALSANNLTLPAGSLTSNGKTLPIRVGNTFTSLDDIKNLVVGSHTAAAAATPGAGAAGAGAAGAGAGAAGYPGAAAGAGAGAAGYPGAGAAGAAAAPSAAAPAAKSTPVKLSDVATVTEDLSPATTITRTNGQDSLGISLTKTSDGNSVAISQGVNSKISSLESTIGHNTKLTIISDQAPSVSAAVNGLVREGIIGAVFAILVILLFLFSIRSTLVTAISIPLSILIALLGLYFGNYSLNLLTLGGLTIAVGRVIDDSIVVLENIYRHLSSGEDKQTAIFNGVREVATAVTASTLTTVAVFLPIAFTTGIIGELFKSFSITVTIALLASLFVALTIIPVLAFWFLKAPKNAGAHHEEQAKPNLLERIYISMLRWVTGHRAITLIVAILLFVGSMSFVGRLGTNLFDSSSSNSFSISQTLPDNTSLDTTNQAATQVENVIKGVSGIATYQVTIGSGGSFLATSNADNSATYTVTTASGADEAKIQSTVANRLKNLANVGKVTVAAASSGGPGGGNTISVNVHASDTATLNQASSQVYNAVSKIANTTNVASNLSNAAPLIDIKVDPNKAQALGLTASTVGQTLRAIYSGSTTTTITLNGTQEDVDIKLGSPATTVDAIKNILIGPAHLGDIATVTQTTGPTQITHIDTKRTATISADVTSSNVGAVTADVTSSLKKLSLPGGATYDLGGISSSQSSAFQSLLEAIAIAILLVYLIMVATFRSLVQPLILLISIPFAATGSVLLLFITHTTLGAPALIGLLMLVGIVVTNAIVLIDLIHQYRNKGLTAREAVIEGGRRRLRPILMTAIATILALTPMALGLDGSSGFIAGPLAIVVIGGLTTSTFLTLLLVPVLYTLIDRDKKAPKQPADAPTPAPQPSIADVPTHPVASVSAE